MQRPDHPSELHALPPTLSRSRFTCDRGQGAFGRLSSIAGDAVTALGPSPAFDIATANIALFDIAFWLSLHGRFGAAELSER